MYIIAFRVTKLWHLDHDDNFDEAKHIIVDLKKQYFPIYQIDDLDYSWIAIVNEERECLGEPLLYDWMLEEMIETLEHMCYVKMNEKVRELEMQSLEFDENAKCDICLHVSFIYLIIFL